MTTTDNLIKDIIEKLEKTGHIRPDDIPNIDLYMDQVTTFINTHLDGFKRYPDDKILTKTMINNYAKNDLLPSPEKKKYAKNHLLMMIFIYYFKGFLSISDIQKMLAPIAKEHFAEDSEPTLPDIYETIFSLEKGQLKNLQKELDELNALSKTVFEDAKEKEMLQTFALICLLSFDVYMKKKIIETMIDELIPTPVDTKTEKKEKKEKKEAK